VYTSEYAAGLDADEKQICFALSFMKGGLPEKFVANFIDQVIEQTTDSKDWGTLTTFNKLFDEAFKDENKKSNAKNQIAHLKQGSKMAEEFFAKFNQLAHIAGYNDGHHGDILIKLIKDAIHNNIIDLIYNAGTLPDTYANWKVRITNIDNIQHQRALEKKSHVPTVVHKTIVVDKAAATNIPMQKTGTGITYGRAGQKMDINKARQSGLFFRCDKPGRISRNCSDKKGFQIRCIVEGLTDEEKKELKKELENPKQGF
jgi:Retrotransposon gag protein